MALFDFSNPGGVPTVTCNPLAKPANTLIASLVFALLAGSTWAQTGTPTPLPNSTPKPLVADVSFLGPQWNELNPVQKSVLLPLAGKWNDLPAERKSKWLAIAQRYPTLAPDDQKKLQGRMSEWAALKPRDRERARLNYAETKKLPPP